MQPQVPPTPVSSPSPNPQYDFILKDAQTPKRSFGLPGIPKPILLLGGVIVLLLVVIIFAVIAGGGKSTNTQQLVAVAGRAQEIARISALVQQQSKDTNTQYLAATTLTSLTSEQHQLTSYLTSHKLKPSPAQLAAYQNKTTDAQLQTAQQNNSLEPAYASYLKNAMATYQTTLQSAAKGAGKTSLAILANANSSSAVILASPEVTAAQ